MSNERPLVFLVNRLKRGGAERLLVDDINEYLRRGVCVRLITLKEEDEENSLATECRLAPQDWVRVSCGRLMNVGALRELSRLLREWQPRAIVTHLWLANTVGRIAARFAHVPRIIAFEHNVYGRRKHRSQYAIDWVLARVATSRIIAVSQAVYDFLVERSIPRDRLVVLRNAIDLERYTQVSDTGIRKEFGIPSDALVFLCISRLIYQKGLDVLLRAWSQVPRAMLIIVGDGAERETLLQRRQSLGLGDRVKFVGTQVRIPEFLAAANAFVLPSRWEGLPMVLLEAMAAKLPIVASAVDGTKEVLTHETNGLLVPPENEEALVKALRRIGEDGGLRLSLGRQAGIDVAAYDIRLHVDRLEQVISSTKEF